MKGIRIVLTLCILGGAASAGLLSLAQTTSPPTRQKVPPPNNALNEEILGCVASKPAGNLMVAFVPPYAGTRPPDQRGIGAAVMFPSDKAIPFGFASTSNIFEIFRLAPEYGYRISARSEDDTAVRLTKVGRRYGRRFDQVKGYDERALDWSGEYYAPDNRKVRFGSARPFRTLAAGSYPSFQTILPPLDDLFKFDKPGRYIVQIEVQCFSRPFPPASTNMQIVRFPPVKLTVEKGGTH